MHSVFIALGFLAFCIIIIFNIPAISQGVKNCVRVNGTISWKRVGKELKHLGRYLVALAVATFLLVTLVYIAIIVVHTYIIPLNIVEDVFSMFRINPVAWEEQIKQGPMGNIDQKYEDWGTRQGYVLETPEILADILFENWPLWLFVIVLLAFLLYFVQVKVLVLLTNHYVKHTLIRRSAYYHRDIQRAKEEVE